MTKLKKVFYNKLVRDRIPEVIKKAGGLAEFKELSPEEFKKELLLKVGEEASGLLNAESKEKLASEIADIYAVLDEIKKLEGVSQEDIDEAMRKNFEKKGGFDKRLFLVWSEDTGYKSNERKNDGRK